MKASFIDKFYFYLRGMLAECFRTSEEWGWAETLSYHEHANGNLDEANLWAIQDWSCSKSYECQWIRPLYQCFTNRTHTWISRCIMALNVFKEYKGRPMGQDILNRKLQIYGVKIITVREFKRNENRNRTFWKLIRIWYDFGAKIVLTLYIIGTKNEPNLENKKK